MSILLNFNGLNNSFRELSELSSCCDFNFECMNEVIRRNRVLMSPSRFMNKGSRKKLEQSLELCSDTRKAIFCYFGKNKLEKLEKRIGYDIVKRILEEYILLLKKMNYDVGEGNFLLMETLKEDISIVYASEVQLIEEKYI